MLKPYYKSWGIKEDVKGVDFEPLPMRECTKAELNIDDEEVDPDSKFFEPHKNSVSDLSFYYRKLKCLDVDDLEVQGDYNSPTTRSFVLLFEKCSSENDNFKDVQCKSDDEIKQWLARKFILILQNNERFSTRLYGDEKVAKESRTVWIPINSQVREEIVYKVQLTDLRLQDNYYQFSALTEDDRQIFSNRL